MEFNISLKEQQADLAVLEAALLSIDPAALLDLDESAAKLRVSTCATEMELLTVMAKCGHAISRTDIELMPSICCGGCSG